MTTKRTSISLRCETHPLFRFRSLLRHTAAITGVIITWRGCCMVSQVKERSELEAIGRHLIHDIVLEIDDDEGEADHIMYFKETKKDSNDVRRPRPHTRAHSQTHALFYSTLLQRACAPRLLCSLARAVGRDRSSPSTGSTSSCSSPFCCS